MLNHLNKHLSKLPRLLPKKLVRVCIFLLLVCTSVLPKLHDLQNPALNDQHYHRQLITFSITERIFLGEGSLLYPRTYQAINPSDPQTLHLGELPIYEYLVAQLFRLTGISVLSVRLLNIFFSTCITFLIYKIGEKIYSRKYGLISALIFCFFPAIVFWGRAESPEIFGLLCLITAITLCLRGAERWKSILLVAGLLTVTVLTKGYYLVYLPLCMYLLQVINKVSFKKVSVVAILPIVATVIWRAWALHFKYANWIVTDHVWLLLNNQQGWFQYYIDSRWGGQLFQRYIVGQLLTPLGGILAIDGLVISANFLKKPYQLLLIYYVLCSFVISFVVAAGSTWHDYYSLHWLPVAALAAGVAVLKLVECICKYIVENFHFPHKTVDFYNGYFFLVAIGITTILLIFTGVREYFSYRDIYFAPQTLLGTSAYLTDYQKIKNFLSPEDRLVSIQYGTDPSMLNGLQHVGYVIDYGYGNNCPTDSNMLQIIEDRKQDLQPRYVIIDLSTKPGEPCQLTHADDVLRENYPLIFKGKKVHLYQIPR